MAYVKVTPILSYDYPDKWKEIQMIRWRVKKLNKILERIDGKNISTKKRS